MGLILEYSWEDYKLCVTVPFYLVKLFWSKWLMNGSLVLADQQL